MSTKKVSIGAKPTSKAAPVSADDWVENRDAASQAPEATERMKRLTIDVPESLHRAIKRDCADRGNKIADEVRELLMQKYGKQ